MPRRVQCAEFEELAMLYAAGELGDEDRAAADAHAQECAACAATLSSELAWRDAWAAKEPASDKLDRSGLLLAQCRSELAEALDDAEGGAAPRGGKNSWRSWFSPARPSAGWAAGWAAAAFRHALAFHPGWSTAVLLIAGALGGTVGRTWYRATSLPLPGKPVMTVSAAPRLSEQELETMGIAGIRWEPQNGATPAQVELQLRSERPVTVQGSADDSEIRRVLTYVLGHGQRFDPGVRLDSLEILGTHVADPQVRAALCEAAVRDSDPAVRLKALEVLRGLGGDSSVQQAMLGALAEDDNSGVRIEAVNALLASLGDEDFGNAHGAAPNGTLLDPQSLGILRDRAHNDPNSYVRLQSGALLGRLASLEEGTADSGVGPRP
jgi:hypothetical protein